MLARARDVLPPLPGITRALAELAAPRIVLARDGQSLTLKAMLDLSDLPGLSPDGLLPETVEFADHPWFIGVQYHPELKSRPFEPHPLFASFIAAAKAQSRLV